MTVDTVAHAHVEQAVIEQASAIFSAFGMTVDEAFRLMLLRTAADQAMPFDPLIPNAETIAAMEAARRGEVSTFHSLEELMADLNADDEAHPSFQEGLQTRASRPIRQDTGARLS